MVVHYSLPKIKITITHNGADSQLENYHTITDVMLVENGISQAIIKASDNKGETFLNKADLNDNLKIETQFADKPGASWTQIFGGWVFDLTPSLTSDQGEIVTLTARGYGLALLAMAVGEEYGTESSNPAVNTIKEILTDASTGIIPKWVHKVLNTATNSGYTLDTSKVADITSDFRYLYWAFAPPKKALDDMVDLIRAANTPNAGAHWIIIPDGTTGYLCLATVGNHENPPADIWPTWWNTDQAGSTLEVTKDMVISSFTKQRSDANYILYHGKFVKPLDLDAWTEGNSSSWGTHGGMTATDDTGIVGAGPQAIKLTTSGSPSFPKGYYPSTINLNLNITNISGEHDVPIVHFWAKCSSSAYSANTITHFIFLTSSTSNYYSSGPTGAQTVFSGGDTWTEIVLPLGPEAYKRLDLAPNWFVGWNAFAGSPDWADIDAVGGMYSTAVTGHELWFDNYYITGSVLRGARDDTKIATQKCRVKLISDHVAKDDTLASGTLGTTDVGAMAQLAKAELYRAITTPIIGTFVIPGKDSIWPGQLCHVHFSQKADGSFNIDSNMRFLRVNHRFAPEPHGFRTYLTVTNDVLNSRALDPSTGYALLMKATNPDYQTRERASFKSRDIDITQTILSENYTTSS